MRTVAAAVCLLLSAQIVDAGERSAVWSHLARLDARASLAAYWYWQCTAAAAKDAAARDKVTPSSLMTDSAAKEAAEHCASLGRALIAAAGWSRAAIVKAAVRRANVEAARRIRHGEPGWACAVESRGCPITP
jgi:hypothetical protein